VVKLTLNFSTKAAADLSDGSEFPDDRLKFKVKFFRMKPYPNVRHRSPIFFSQKIAAANFQTIISLSYGVRIFIMINSLFIQLFLQPKKFVIKTVTDFDKNVSTCRNCEKVFRKHIDAAT
jgi:hypothetical protein